MTLPADSYVPTMFLSIVNTFLISLDKIYNIFQTTRFNHTMIFFKLTD